MNKIKETLLRFWRQLKTDHKTQVITGIVVLVIVAGGALYHHQTNVTGEWYPLDNIENEKINIEKDGYTTTESGGVLEKSAGTVKINKRNHEIDFDGKPARYKLDPSKGKLVLYNAGGTTPERSHAPVMQGMYDDSDDDSDRGMNPNNASVILVRKDSKLYKDQIKKNKQAIAKANADAEARKKREARQKEERKKQAANIFAGKTWVLKDQDTVMKAVKDQFPSIVSGSRQKTYDYIVTKIEGDSTGKFATLTYTKITASPTDNDGVTKLNISETPNNVQKRVRFTPDDKSQSVVTKVKSVVTDDNDENKHLGGEFEDYLTYLTLKKHGNVLETYISSNDRYDIGKTGKNNELFEATYRSALSSLVYEQQK